MGKHTVDGGLVHCSMHGGTLKPGTMCETSAAAPD